MSRPPAPEDQYALTLAEHPQLSPDGERIAYVVTTIDRPTYEYRRAIWIAPAAGGEPRRYTAGPNDSSPAWSPDGRSLAFVRAPAGDTKPKNAEERDRGVGRPQIWILPADGGEARQLTFERHGAGSPTWSPDSSALLYTSARGADDDPEAADARLDGKNVPAVRTIDRLWNRADGQGWIYERRTHLFSIPAHGGSPRQLTDGDWDDTNPAWSPDGGRIAFTSDRTDERWRWPGSDVWVLDIASGDLRRLTDGTVRCDKPAWSPDGRSLAFTSSLRRGSGGHVDLFLAPADGTAAPRSLTSDFVPCCGNTCIDDQRGDHGASDLYWSRDGGRVYFLASFRGTAHVYVAQPDTSATPQPLTKGQSHVYAFSMDADRHALALGISDPVVPGDVYVATVDRPAEPRRLTALNAGLFAEMALAYPEEFSFTGADGWTLQGWVMRPAGTPAEKPLPAVLEIHGGPSAMYGWSFFFEFQLLAAAGFAVVYSNPRGSTGYGRVFSSAITDDWGGNDYADVMAGLDAAIARGGIDPERLAVAGGSYGGYMTSWIVGHTDRFKAAISMRAVNDFAAFFGTSDIGPFFTVDHLHAVPWEQLDKLMSHSPITYVANIHTPLLILHSENDLRCPIEQGEQLFSALSYLGREVRMVRFEGQSHGLSRNGHPRSRVLRLRHILTWLTDHIPV